MIESDSEGEEVQTLTEQENDSKQANEKTPPKGKMSTVKQEMATPKAQTGKTVQNSDATVSISLQFAMYIHSILASIPHLQTPDLRTLPLFF